jgi:hypothetical protein
MPAVKPTLSDPKLPLVANAPRVDQHNSINRKNGDGMAEGMLGGILGDEDEKPEVESPDALAGAEAFAAAIAAIASRQDPGVARRTEEFLSDQSHLLKIQARHLEDEHALRVAHLRNQLRRKKSAASAYVYGSASNSLSSASQPSSESASP